MGGVYSRGGIPRVVRLVTDTTPYLHPFPFYSNWVKFRNLGSADVKVYILVEDATADVNYITVPVAAAENPNGEWEGPLELEQIFVASASAGLLEVTATQRRG